MTYGEAIEELKVIYAFCNTEPKMQDAINTVIKHSVKYGWHDLRKDPFDLPSKTDLYLISYKAPYNGKIYTTLEVYHEQEKEWGTPMGYEVVAWKELEILEEEEE